MNFNKKLDEAFQGDMPAPRYGRPTPGGPRPWSPYSDRRRRPQKAKFEVQVQDQPDLNHGFNDFDRAKSYVKELFKMDVTEVNIKDNETGETATLNR